MGCLNVGVGLLGVGGGAGVGRLTVEVVGVHARVLLANRIAESVGEGLSLTDAVGCSLTEVSVSVRLLRRTTVGDLRPRERISDRA